MEVQPSTVIQIAHALNYFITISGEPYLERFPDVWLDEDKQMSDTIMTLWASFARTGYGSQFPP